MNAFRGIMSPHMPCPLLASSAAPSPPPPMPAFRFGALPLPPEKAPSPGKATPIQFVQPNGLGFRYIRGSGLYREEGRKGGGLQDTRWMKPSSGARCWPSTTTAKRNGETRASERKRRALPSYVSVTVGRRDKGAERRRRNDTRELRHLGFPRHYSHSFRNLASNHSFAESLLLSGQDRTVRPVMEPAHM